MRATLLLTAASMFGCTSKTALDGTDSPTVDSEVDSDSGSHHSDSDSAPHSDSTADTDTDTDTDADSDSDADADADSDTADTGPEPDRELEFVLVAAGTFQMGCTASQYDCDSDETEHTVTLTRDYYVATTEVTQHQFETAMGYNPSDFPDCGNNCPVDDVSWHEATKFANLRSVDEGLAECYTCTSSSPPSCVPNGTAYDCEGYRLLTEAEWEAAARCGTDYTYAGSDVVEDVAWYHSNSGAGDDYGPNTIATLAPNDCGLYDMSGNIDEWVQDAYAGDYGAAAATDPEVTEPPEPDRLLRGGGWEFDAEYARVASRVNAWGHASSQVSGFRLARTAP